MSLKDPQTLAEWRVYTARRPKSGKLTKADKALLKQFFFEAGVVWAFWSVNLLIYIYLMYYSDK
jgi:hypothetical protein